MEISRRHRVKFVKDIFLCFVSCKDHNNRKIAVDK
jgi:hypothetical protein